MTHILYCSYGQLVHVDDQEDGGQSECPGCRAVVKAPASGVAKTVDWRSSLCLGWPSSPRCRRTLAFGYFSGVFLDPVLGFSGKRSDNIPRSLVK